MGTRLYVGNLPFSADETAIRELFATNGRAVTEVKLATPAVPAASASWRWAAALTPMARSAT